MKTLGALYNMLDLSPVSKFALTFPLSCFGDFFLELWWTSNFPHPSPLHYLPNYSKKDGSLTCFSWAGFASIGWWSHSQSYSIWSKICRACCSVQWAKALSGNLPPSWNYPFDFLSPRHRQPATPGHTCGVVFVLKVSVHLTAVEDHVKSQPQSEPAHL